MALKKRAKQIRPPAKRMIVSIFCYLPGEGQMGCRMPDAALRAGLARGTGQRTLSKWKGIHRNGSGIAPGRYP